MFINSFLNPLLHKIYFYDDSVNKFHLLRFSILAAPLNNLSALADEPIFSRWGMAICASTRQSLCFAFQYTNGKVISTISLKYNSVK